MPNVLTLTVEQPDEVLNAGAYGAGALMRVQSSATEAGAYVDLTGTGSTPTVIVVTGTRAYTGYDPGGDSSTWYRTRFENVGATRLSEWSPSFQVAAPEPTQPLLCELADVKQRLGHSAAVSSTDELLLDIIREVSAQIENETGRWFAPRTATFHISPERATRRLAVPKGVRSVTSIGYATSDQPDTAGTYTAIATTNISLQPPALERSPGWPAMSLELLLSAGAWFYPGLNTVEAVLAAGWPAPPLDIQSVAIEATIRKFIGKETQATAVSLGPSGGVTILRNLSPDSQRVLARYAYIPVG